MLCYPLNFDMLRYKHTFVLDTEGQLLLIVRPLNITENLIYIALYFSSLPINPPVPHCDQAPAPWWDREADRSLIIGSFKHGYEQYYAMRSDPCLCFLTRLGPPPPPNPL